MNQEIEYHNHKNRLGNLRQETKAYKLAKSSNLDVNKILSLHKIVTKNLTAWVSNLKASSATETNKDYSPTLQQEQSS